MPGDIRQDLSLSLVGVAVEEVFTLDMPEGELILPDLFLCLVWGVFGVRGPTALKALLRL